MADQVMVQAPASPGKPGSGEDVVVQVLPHDRWDQEAGAPPILGYSMTPSRRRSLIYNILFIIFFNVLCPPMIWYIVWHFDQRHIRVGNNNLLYGLTTATLGTLQIPQAIFRGYLCYKRNHYRERESRLLVIKAFQRWDSFQIGFAVGIVIGTTVLLLACSLDGAAGFYPLLALFPAIIFAYIGILFLASALLAHFKVPLPLMCSDRPAGEPIRPALAYVWTDLVAVDGSGLCESRQRFTMRYERSPLFRAMIRDLNTFLGVVFTFQLVPAVILVALDEDRHVTYGLTFAMLASILAVTGLTGLAWARSRIAKERLFWSQHTSNLSVSSIDGK